MESAVLLPHIGTASIWRWKCSVRDEGVGYMDADARHWAAPRDFHTCGWGFTATDVYLGWLRHHCPMLVYEDTTRVTHVRFNHKNGIRI